MDLQQFVTQSLQDIVAAVRSATVDGKPVRMHLFQMGEKENGPRGVRGERPHIIEFDIAVSVGKESKIEGEAKGGIIQVLSAGVDTSLAERRESVSRIKFSVPVSYD